MKSILLISTKFRVYLTEIPPIILLSVVLHFNDRVEGVFKLYPLIVFLSAVIIFIPIYFTRGVVVAYDELRCVGIFSSRDRAFITEDKTIVLTCLKKRRIRVELFEKSSGESAFSWMKSDPNTEINIFRAKVGGTEKTVLKILTYFGAEKQFARTVIENETAETDLGEITLKSELSDDEKKISIHFNETL